MYRHLRCATWPFWASFSLSLKMFFNQGFAVPTVSFGGGTLRSWSLVIWWPNLFSSSEDAISRASLRTLLAPPWASILLGMRCFATMPHGAPQGFSMVLAGPSRHLWLCILCLVYLPCCIALYALNLAVPKMLFREHLCARFCWLCLVCLLYLPCIAFYALNLAVPKMLFREHLCARLWHRLGLESCCGCGFSQPCPTVLQHAIPWYWPVHPDIYMALPCMPCKYALYIALYALYSAVPKMLFREHLCTRLWHRLRLQSCWGSGVSQPCPRCSTGLFHGTGRSIQTSMALPCMPSIFALYCIVCLQFSGSEDAISRASLRTLLAPPWAWILLRIRCFATMPHNAPHGVSMVLAGPSGHLWLCLLCLVYLPCIALYALNLAVPKMLFREHLCARFWHRLGLESCWGSGVSQPCPRCSTGLFHGTGRSIQTSMALPSMPCIFALYIALYAL